MFDAYGDLEWNKKTKKVVASVVAGVLIIIGILLSISIVSVNTVGVKYSDMRGTVTEEPLNPGVHMKIPFVDRVTKVSTELRSADIDDLQITTEDAQAVTIDIEMQYHVMPEDAVQTFTQFRSTPEEEWITTFVYQRIQRGVQDASSRYTVIELMGEKRGDFQLEVDEAVAVAMEENNLTVHTASVDDVQVSKSIKGSIEANAKAKQDVETARQVKAKQTVENETKVEKATADASVKTIDAEAEADANKKLQSSVTPELVDYMEAQARMEHGWYKYQNMEPTIVEEGE